ncbi:hypothetical protein HFRIS_020070 [Herbaspirillum frisingense GSF30]|uniref:Uncharacterized protein n=1 Tax=Herbaspirillum frisingense GSF30 TaxID=864073 RepID=A0AAI9IBI8_9BURK|nr:ABC transporter permease [Herbaspirillum frisingense]EOA02944.1 hypothetical protein HFRIS_020070 [Herbaspirillum frisingense GSF30]
MDSYDSRKFHYTKPKTPEETVSAIYEELSITPLTDREKRPEQTIKGYLASIYKNLNDHHWADKNRREDRERSEGISLGTIGVLGLILVLLAANTNSDWEWWRTYSYFFFVMGFVLTVMFAAASMERSLPISRILKFNSAKVLCALIFSAAVIYASSQASGQLNSIFQIDGSNLPYTRAILSAVFFLKMCTPFLFVLALFAVIHGMVVWNAARNKEDVFLFPWNSLMFIVSSLLVAGNFWWLTHVAFGDDQIRSKAYKLAHYLDFSEAAYCVNSSSLEEERKSYLFFGQDQNKVLIDKKLSIQESFEQFVKNRSAIDNVYIPSKYSVVSCGPMQKDVPSEQASQAAQEGMDIRVFTQ